MASLGENSGSESIPLPLRGASNPPIQKTFSCVLCAQRKVKCDKKPGGCANCAKSRVECIYKAPPPPRRRKKGMREIDMNTRLRLYENALKKLGVDPSDLVKEKLFKAVKARPDEDIEQPHTKKLAESDVDAAEKHAGVLVANEGKSIYLENSLWARLQSEFHDTKDILEESSDEDALDTRGFIFGAHALDLGEIIFGSPASSGSLRYLHPDSMQIFQLWQKYLNNVNPLVKILHTPSTQQLVLDASSNLENIPCDIEALMFAIYCQSLSTLNDEECHNILGLSRPLATRKFRTAAQQALVNASFLKSSDVRVLQAFVLFILSLQNSDARITWIFTGIAGRIGQRIGIHRDGSTLGLPPFETEMRRRLWWQILMMEGIAEKLAGTSTNSFFGDAQRPLNLNDSDLIPGMEEFPPEHEGATDMMFFLIRCHVGQFLKHTLPSTGFDGYWSKLSASSVAQLKKAKAIDELEALFERKFIKFCDPSIPWHFMCIYLCKAIVCMMRFTASCPEHPPYVQPSQKDKDQLFDSCLRVVGYQNFVYTMDHMRGFQWHVNTQFQWKAVIYLISELRHRAPAPEADEAWEQIGVIYRNHPLFTKEVAKRALPIAIGNLTLKAWDAFITARGVPEQGEPDFILSLRMQRLKRRQTEQSAHVPSPGPQTALNQSETMTSAANLDDLPLDPLQDEQWKQWNADVEASLDTSTSFANMPQLPLDSDQMNWSVWDTLLTSYHTDESYAGPSNNWAA